MVESVSSDVVDRQFEVGDGAFLSIGTASGRISVRAEGERVIHVHARKHRCPAPVEETRIEFRQTGSAVHVRTRGSETDEHGSHRICPVDFDVTVPLGTVVEASGVSANVDVRGTGAPAQLGTVSGSVEIENARGQCSLKSVSGRIVARSVSGELVVETTSGSTEITESELKTLDVQGVSGSVTVDASLSIDGRYHIRTVSGDVRVMLLEGSGASVDMSSVSGRVSSELPSNIVKAGFGSWRGEVAGGGPELRLNTVSGTLHIVRR